MSQQSENIGPRQRRRRVVMGTLVLACTLAFALVLVRLGVDRSLRLAVFFPLLAGTIGLLQVPARTCVSLAAQGLKDMDDGPKPVTDADERRCLAAQARRVIALSLGISVALTGAFWLL